MENYSEEDRQGFHCGGSEPSDLGKNITDSKNLTI